MMTLKTAAKAPETIYIRVSTLMPSLPLLFRVFYSVFGVKIRVLQYTAVVTAAHLCRAHFYRSTLQKRPLKHQNRCWTCLKTYTACAATLPWIFFVFIVHRGGLRYTGRRGDYPVHLNRPPFTTVRPENGRKRRKSTRNHLYTCVNTNAVFAATFPCILFRFWHQNKSTAVYCGVLRYSGIPLKIGP